MESEEQITPKKPFYKKITRFFLWFSLFIILLTCIGVSLVFIYEDEVKGVIIKELNKNLKAEIRIDPKNIDLTFISSFPKCAIEFKNLTAMEAWQVKEKDTLAFVESLSLRFSLKDLFDKKYDIKQISIKNARCYLKVNKKGQPNYEVWKSDDTSHTSNDSLKFKLEGIKLKNIIVLFKNNKQKVKLDFIINDLLFKGDFSENNYEMSSEGQVKINSIGFGKITYLKNKNLNLDAALNINSSNYIIKKVDLALNKMFFEANGNFIYKDSLENLKLNYNAKNLDIESILSLLPEKYKERINDYKSTGEFFANGDLVYTNTDFSTHTKFGIAKATIEYKPKSSVLTNVVIRGELAMDKTNSHLNIEQFNADLSGDNINGKLFIENFNDPLINASANGKFKLQNFYSFWPIDTLQKLEGNLKFNGNVKGKLSDLKQNAFSEKLSLGLNVEVDSLKVKFKNDEKEIAIESCKIIARDRDINVENFRLKKGKSDVEVNGTIPGMFNYLLDNKAPLIIKGTLISVNFEMEDFIFNGNTSKAASEGEFSMPANVNLVLDAGIKHFSFGKFEATEITGNFELKNQKAMVSDMKFKTMEGEASVDALVDGSGKELEVSLQSQLKNLNVKKMFFQLNNFGQTTLLDKNINGYITAAINFSGNWNKKLEPLLNSIMCTSDFNIERGELIDFKPLESLAKFVDVQELKRIKFSSLSSNMEIRKSVIYIPKTAIKNSALNLDFSGTHTFNNDVDYHIRLLISDLLAKKRKADDEFGPVENDPDNRRSAFILMTGNIDNLIIKYDKQGLKQKIKEDIKQEKQNLKQILKEEFGAFKRDTLKKTGTKAGQKFELEKPGNNMPKKTLELKKKKEEDDEDF